MENQGCNILMVIIGYIWYRILKQPGDGIT